MWWWGRLQLHPRCSKSLRQQQQQQRHLLPLQPLPVLLLSLVLAWLLLLLQ